MREQVPPGDYLPRVSGQVVQQLELAPAEVEAHPVEGDLMGARVQPEAAHLKRLRRIEGQIRGLQRMVEDDKYCIDILTQVSAATKALQSFSLELLDEHLEHCVVDAARRGGPEADEKVREASEAIARLVRS